MLRLPGFPGLPGASRPGRLAAALVLLLLFALVTWQVAVGGPLRSLDERISRAVAGRGPRPVTELLADLGSLRIALPVLAAALLYTAWRPHPAAPGDTAPHGDRRHGLPRGERGYAILRAVLAIAAVPALVVPLKALLDRPGPLTEATGYYPSGHAATALVAFGAAALLLRPALPPAARAVAMPAAGLLTLATGIGLVLRGYHWPLDVIGSWCLFGALLLLLFPPAGPPADPPRPGDQLQR
ncbi:phosphatase PAP2 family protein [Streptomyces tsukubensis]|uniref:phosphatase PAP2 family protein n=1 Tax=Streptomyces tsukubensis TaxID=83656 RepID=UPI00344B58BD